MGADAPASVETDAGLLNIAMTVLDRLSDPEAIFGDSSTAPSFEMDIAGVPFVIRDAISYEGGSAGVVGLARLLGGYGFDTDAIRRAHAEFSRRKFPRELAGGSVTLPGSFLGAYSIAQLEMREDSRWGAVYRPLRGALEAKARTEIRAVREALTRGSDLGSIGTYDLVCGLSRTAIVLSHAEVESDSTVLEEAAYALSSLLKIGDPRGGPHAWVEGPPFFVKGETNPIPAHLNMGTAHGSMGVLSAAVSAIESSISAGGDRSHFLEALAQIAKYVEWAEDLSRSGTLPMYATDPDGTRIGSSLADPQLRPAWCYGAVGQQMAMMSAGRLIQAPEVVHRAVENLKDIEGRIDLFADLSLCHGLSGAAVALYLAGSAALDTELLAAGRRLAQKAAESFDESSPFCFSYSPDGLQIPAQVPGVLNGAAGIAMALSICGGPPIPEAAAFGLIGAQAPWVTTPSRELEFWSPA